MSTHHIRIVLRHVVPTVMREVIVPSNLSMERLHEVLQTVMEWDNSHLHLFARKHGPRQRMLFEPKPPPE